MRGLLLLFVLAAALAPGARAIDICAFDVVTSSPGQLPIVHAYTFCNYYYYTYNATNNDTLTAVQAVQCISDVNTSTLTFTGTLTCACLAGFQQRTRRSGRSLLSAGSALGSEGGGFTDADLEDMMYRNHFTETAAAFDSSYVDEEALSDRRSERRSSPLYCEPIPVSPVVVPPPSSFISTPPVTTVSSGGGSGSSLPTAVPEPVVEVVTPAAEVAAQAQAQAAQAAQAQAAAQRQAAVSTGRTAASAATGLVA
eukprot:CAMPEP_0114119754 /NCGR_PEP_ID=MMETSP0043_2-20121206/6280_1 /TAXON_ID=464988 /ORGANISM="Hemiselmis andersenii, Strain CCMP644" /LENGTH=253 /DNA_ID=CAMNT_0001212323 /DNA_START=1 /DNA_END=758 /DNA_ORIENTATION=-